MAIPTLMKADELIEHLRLLCAQPSTTGNFHELNLVARMVADMVRQTGLDVKIVRTGGAPVIVGWRAGRHPTTLLLYHHYDIPPPGPWREWSHEPFQIAERDDQLYGRGVAQGKGPLIAHLQAIRALLQVENRLPHGLAIIVEGERLMGSPNLEKVIQRYADKLDVHACLGSGGERDKHGKPFCYSGSKGLLQVLLSARGPSIPLSSALAASVGNPAWQIAWALGSIKGADEDIRINGFYDSIEGPGRQERALLREVELDEAGRLSGWQIPEFLFGMSGSALVRTEVTLPTCNLSSFTIEPPNGSSVSSIPTSASARLDFQLVPQQTPDEIFQMLCHHLRERGLTNIEVEQLPGAYSPVQGKAANSFIQRVAATGKTLYEKELTLLPFGPFTLPLYFLTHYFEAPSATIAIARQDSSEYGPDEHLPIEDLICHGQTLIEMMTTYSEDERAVSS